MTKVKEQQQYLDLQQIVQFHSARKARVLDRLATDIRKTGKAFCSDIHLGKEDIAVLEKLSEEKLETEISDVDDGISITAIDDIPLALIYKRNYYENIMQKVVTVK